MSAFLSPLFGAGSQLFDNQGRVLAGGKILTFLAGSTTPAATWTDSLQSVQNPNPVILDSAGRVPNEIWLQSGQKYKFVTEDSNNNVIGYTYDNVSGVNDVTVSSSEWTGSGATPTFVNATTFTVPGNLTSTFHVNRRIQASVSAGTVYGYVVSSAFTSLTTVVVSLDSGALDSGLSAVNVALLRADTPSVPEQVLPSGTATLSNKSIDLGSNSVTGTLAQFNTALTNADFASLAGAEVLTNKTLLAAGPNTVEATSGPSTSAFCIRNIIFNGDFRINQRTYVSAATLAAGIYGHDRWKAGASGGDYSFTQLPNSTTITIAAAKTLIQVVEDKNVSGGSYVLSWTGTAQARAGINSATPSGSFVTSPMLIVGQTAGTVMSIEFNAGTLGKVQIEQGATATPFEQRPVGVELSLCERYYCLANAQYSGHAISTTSALIVSTFPVTMRTTPTLGTTLTLGSLTTAAGGTQAVSSVSSPNPTTSGAYFTVSVASGLIAGNGTLLINSINQWSAEL